MIINKIVGENKASLVCLVSFWVKGLVLKVENVNNV